MKRKEKNEESRSLNEGTMTGKSTEAVDMLMRRKVDVCCIQESRFIARAIRSSVEIRWLLS